MTPSCAHGIAFAAAAFLSAASFSEMANAQTAQITGVYHAEGSRGGCSKFYINANEAERYTWHPKGCSGSADFDSARHWISGSIAEGEVVRIGIASFTTRSIAADGASFDGDFRMRGRTSQLKFVRTGD